MKQEYRKGWYKVKPVFDGVKYEVTYFNGINIYCEDVRIGSYADACSYCKGKINAAQPG